MGHAHSHHHKGHTREVVEERDVVPAPASLPPAREAPPLPKAVLGYCDAKTLLKGCWLVSKAVHERCWTHARLRLFLVTHEASIEFRDVWTGELVWTKALHKSTVSCVQVVTVDGEDHLVTCADRDRVKVWHLPSMRLVREWNQKSVTAVSVNVATNTIAVGVDSEIRLLPFDRFHLPGRDVPYVVLKEYLLSEIRALVLLPAGGVVAVGGYYLMYFDPQGRRLLDIPTNDMRFEGSFLSLVPGDPSRVMVLMDKVVRICEATTGAVLKEWKHHKGTVLGSSLSPNGRLFLAGPKPTEYTVSEFSAEGDVIRHHTDFYGVRVLGFGSAYSICCGHNKGDYATDVLQCRQSDGKVVWSCKVRNEAQLMAMLVPF
jgi:hypothetical protein